MNHSTCPQCQTRNAAGVSACTNCGLALGGGSETGPPATEEISAAGVGFQTVRLLQGTLLQLLPVAAVAAGLQLFSSMLTATTMRNTLSLGSVDWKVMLFSGVLSMIVVPVASATYLRALIGYDSKAPAPLGVCLNFGMERGLGLIPSMIALAILAVMCAVVLLIPLALLGKIGTLLLGLGGLLLGMRWFLALPAAVLEGTGLWAGLSRSSELTRSCRPLAAGLLIATLGLSYAVTQVTGDGAVLATLAMSGFASASKGTLLAKAFAANFIQMLVAGVQLTVSYALYRQVMRKYEGGGAL